MRRTHSCRFAHKQTPKCGTAAPKSFSPTLQSLCQQNLTLSGVLQDVWVIIRGVNEKLSPGGGFEAAPGIHEDEDQASWQRIPSES